jgi:dsDNA-specific endonuclease/ATPase MutS2
VCNQPAWQQAGFFYLAIAARGQTRHPARVLPPPEPAPIPLPITGELDLHTFNPRDFGELLPAWLTECQSRGLREVRIVHGKGTGTLRTTVHAHLRRSPLVIRFRLGDETSGSWGATWVTLKPSS